MLACTDPYRLPLSVFSDREGRDHRSKICGGEAGKPAISDPLTMAHHEAVRSCVGVMDDIPPH